MRTRAVTVCLRHSRTQHDRDVAKGVPRHVNLLPLVLLFLAGIALLGLAVLVVGVVAATSLARSRPPGWRRGRLVILGVLPGLILILAAAAWPVWQFEVPHPDPGLEVPVAAACLSDRGFGQPATIDVFQGLSWNQLPHIPQGPWVIAVRTTDLQGRSATCKELVDLDHDGNWVISVTG
jgi:hypothetical protein